MLATIRQSLVWALSHPIWTGIGVLVAIVIGLLTFLDPWPLGPIGQPPQGQEEIVIDVQGFNSDNSTDRKAMAHNYGEQTGILLPDVVIIVRDGSGKVLDRLSGMLNWGLNPPPEPFKLPGNSGATYYLKRPGWLPNGAKRCVLVYQVRRSAHDLREGESPPFECNG